MRDLFRIQLDRDRVFGLDVLRAAAILFVVIGHSGELLPPQAKAVSDLFVFDGVSLFFVLSGFLIGGILIRTLRDKGMRPAVLKTFWVRRWFRTLPNYFLTLTVLCLLELLFGKGIRTGDLLRSLTFTQNLFYPHPWFFPEAWSLSVEEWFYLMLPLLITVLLMLTSRSVQRAVLLSCLSVILLVILFRAYRYASVPINTIDQWDMLFRKQVVTRLDSLMFGVLGAYVSLYHRPLWTAHKRTLLFAGVLLFLAIKFVLPALVPATSLYGCVFSFSTISIATLLLLPYLSELRTSRSILLTPITYISLISYSMYLLNLSVVQNWIVDRLPWDLLAGSGYGMVVLRYVSYWALVIGLSILVYKYFEVPMTRLRERIGRGGHAG